MKETKTHGHRLVPSEIDEGTIDAHRLLVMWLFICTIAVGLSFLALVLYFNFTGGGGLTVGIAVMAAGAGGGFVSSLRRLYSFQDIFPRREYTQLFRQMNFYVVAYSLVPPVVGTIAAIIIYLLFAGGVLKGDLFPDFHCAEGQTCTDFHGFVTYWMPIDAPANAKAIVWGFIAGFSERFVPDILNRFAENSKRAGVQTESRADGP